jgi:hypothetical protein
MFPILKIDNFGHHGKRPSSAIVCPIGAVQCSFHKGYGFFPGTGHVGDIGEGPGRGYSVNVPFYVRLLTPEHQQWVPCANVETVIDAPDHQQLVYQFCCRCIMNILLAPAAVVHKVQLALEQHP